MMRGAYPILRSFAAGLLALFIGLLPSSASAGDPPLRRLGIALYGSELAASFSYRDAFSAPIKRKLKSGLPTRIITQIHLEKQGKREPITYWVRSATIVYDLWEEMFIVTVEDQQGRRHARASSAEGAMNLASILKGERVAETSGQLPGIYRLRVLVEVNPVSKEMIENIRKWLTRPPTQKTGVAQQTNFFGSFVGIFVDRRIGDADRSIDFASQWFRLGEL